MSPLRDWIPHPVLLAMLRCQRQGRGALGLRTGHCGACCSWSYTWVAAWEWYPSMACGRGGVWVSAGGWPRGLPGLLQGWPAGSCLPLCGLGAAPGSQGQCTGGHCSIAGGGWGQCIFREAVLWQVPHRAHRGQRDRSFRRSVRKGLVQLARTKQYPSSWVSFICAFHVNHR